LRRQQPLRFPYRFSLARSRVPDSAPGRSRSRASVPVMVRCANCRCRWMKPSSPGPQRAAATPAHPADSANALTRCPQQRKQKRAHPLRCARFCSLLQSRSMRSGPAPAWPPPAAPIHWL
jgi:hypothetical protein